MRIKITKSKNSSSISIIKDIKKNNKRSTKIVKTLGNFEQIKQKYNCENPIQWAKQYVQELNQKEISQSLEIVSKFSQSKLLSKNSQISFNCGYLFLQKIYNGLNLDKICNSISKKYKFQYDLNDILQKLIFTRILYPSSKLSSFEASKVFLQQPNFEIHDVYRALEVLSNENNFIQSQLYKNSLNVIDRNNKILYYDCTNYFFEIEQEEGLKQYGISKEHRPNPIVQMGLLMDGNGFPLAFTLNQGNTNEQLTLKPLEKQIIKDFQLSEFVVCTDAGLASTNNRMFNSIENRAYIVTQSLKKIKSHIQDWALNKDGWHSLSNPNTSINLDNIDNSSNNQTIYYKERWINENGLEQRLIISYSPKYAEYQRSVRNNQILRAKKIINNPSAYSHSKQTDPKRFIKSTKVTTDGEIANKNIISLDTSIIDRESRFDGFYAVCTTLEDDISSIISANKRRWEIEESFRILKTEFKSRPVYLKRDDRITAHFTTCFLALMVYRILEYKLNYKFSCENIIDTLKNMNLAKIDDENYIPTYTRTDLTDDLHKFLGFRTDRQILTDRNFKKFLK